MAAPRSSAGYIPWWLLLLVVSGFVLAAAILAGVAVSTRTADLPRPTATALVVVSGDGGGQVLPTPFVPPPTETRPGGPTPTVAEPIPTLSSLIPTLGGYVQVVGTGDIGFLNLRAEASRSAAVNYLALEREVFQVQAGPVEADGLVWWFLVDPATGTRNGWGAQNYLTVVAGP
ncbi:MAG: hypothetical protein JNL73_17735 [Anaerolineales bacterium]|nr:hypothetical protein [Anaerolineales bacterium]